MASSRTILLMRSLLLPVTILSVASIRIGISLALVSLCSSRVNCQSDTTNMAKLFHLRQSINVPGIRALGLLFQSPSMLLPHIHIDRIDQLDVVQLKEKHGIRCIVFDKDNTLSYCYSSELHPFAAHVVERSKEVFSNNVAILSNSVGSSDDIDGKMAKATEASLSINVIRHRIKKPGCLDEVLAHFNAHNDPPVLPSQICIVGDRLSTDVAFANMNGMRSVLVEPLSYFRDHPIALILRILENKVLLPVLQVVLGRKHK